MNNDQNNIDHIHLTKLEHIRTHLDARRIEFITTAIICVIFAISFAHLEYYYIKDPALQISNGKVQVDDPNGGTNQRGPIWFLVEILRGAAERTCNTTSEKASMFSPINYESSFTYS